MHRPLRTSTTLAALLAMAAPVAVALVAVALVAEAGGQDEETRRHGIFLDSIDVSLVNVEVVVTKDGAPVPGLRREDFAVTDDGKPVVLSHFYAVRGGYRQVAGTAEAGDATAAGPPREDASLVVLVDNPFLSAPSRQRVFEAVERRLDPLMDGGTRVMIVVKDRQVRVVLPPTTDRDAVRASLAATAEAGGSLDRYVMNSAVIVQQIESAARAGLPAQRPPPPPGSGPGAIPRGISPDTTLQDARHAADALKAITAGQFNEVRASLSVLATFVGALAGLPGKKAVLYVCDRLPLRPGEREWQVWYRKYGLAVGRELGIPSVESQVRDYDLSGALKELLDDATASGVAFYPVGAGLGTRSGFAAERGGSSSTVEAAFSETAAAGAGLRLLAASTGGRAAIGVLRPDAFLDALRQDLGHYYSLGYPSPHRGDGKSHKIEVKVARPGVRVRYLESYADKDADEEMRDRALTAVLLGTAENPFGVEVEAAEAAPRKDGLVEVDLRVRFPLAKLLLVPEEKRHVGDVTILLLIRDGGGRISDPIRVDVPIEIPNEEVLGALTRSALYRTTLALRPGEQTLAVAVRDDLSAESSTVRLDLHLGKGRG